MKEEFAKEFKNKYDGNEDWCGFKRKLLDAVCEVLVMLKTNPFILKCGGGIKMWIWLCEERESYLGFGNSRNEKDWKKYCEAN